VEIRDSARKHGVEDEDIRQAASWPVYRVPMGEQDDPWRELRLGFDRSARLLELILVHYDDGRDLIIHAMSCRQQYLELLP
jgi:hypothetical protein